MTDRKKNSLHYSGELYALTFPGDRPFVYLEDKDGNRVAELFVLSGVHPLEGRDDTTAIEGWKAEETQGHPGGTRGGETIFTLHARSSIWKRKTYRFRCGPRRCVYDVAVEGTGRLTEVQYFGGYSSALPRWGVGFFVSGHTFKRGFNPEPNAETHRYFDPPGGAIIDFGGAPLPGMRHWFFTPPPFCFSFETESDWLALGVEAEPGANRFTEYRYHGQGGRPAPSERSACGFYLSLFYGGYTEVDGEYRLPSVGLDFAPDEYEALRAHVTALRAILSGSPEQAPAHGSKAPPGRDARPSWWERPIFCGWGAQCYRAAQEHDATRCSQWHRVPPGCGTRGLRPTHGWYPAGTENIDHRAFLETMAHAASYARQTVYEEFLQSLAGHGIHPGTVVVDDKWQRTYGENRVDQSKWPDLRGFVERRHADGQKVLLWLKAWDREGVPDEECISNAAGVALTVDPTNPAYERRLRASVRRMLSSGGYDADGFKIDFTHRMPVSPGLRLCGDDWGLELMKRYLGVIYDEAKRVKPDALIMTHTPHPYLADVLDMIRLNDILDLTQLDDPAAGNDTCSAMTFRSRVARIGCPEALIDTDNWPVRNRAIWREYVRLQPDIGVPSLYFSTHIDLTQEPLEAEDYDLLREAWGPTGYPLGDVPTAQGRTDQDRHRGNQEWSALASGGVTR